MFETLLLIIKKDVLGQHQLLLLWFSGVDISLMFPVVAAPSVTHDCGFRDVQPTHRQLLLEWEPARHVITSCCAFSNQSDRCLHLVFNG